MIVHRLNGLNIFQVKWIEPIYEEKKKNVIVHPLSSVPGVFRRFCIFSVKEKRILHFKKGKKFKLVTTYMAYT